MERTKADFIKELLTTAQDSVWRNTLAMQFAEKFGEGKDKDEKVTACKHAIEKDTEYIKFLKVELAVCESLG